MLSFAKNLVKAREGYAIQASKKLIAV